MEYLIEMQPEQLPDSLVPQTVLLLLPVEPMAAERVD